MPHPIRRAAVFCLAAALASCDQPTRSDPPRELGVGMTLEGVVTPGALPVEFTLRLPPGRFRLLLLARSGSAADTLVGHVLNAGGGERGRVTSMGTDTGLLDHASGWVPAGNGDGWRVRVRGQSANDGGAFTVALFPEDPAPEAAPAALAPGQAVEGEVLEVGEDTDEFRLAGVEGEEWIVFAQTSGPRIQVQLYEEPRLIDLGTAQAHEPTAELEERSTGRVRLPRTGQYVVRVLGADADERGAYRIRADRVNRAPESDPPGLQPVTPVEGEIGSVGDADEFTFEAEEWEEVSVAAELVAGMGAGLTMDLLHDGELAARLTAQAPGETVSTGRIALPRAGTWTVRIHGATAGTRAAGTGRYRVTLTRLNLANENAPPLILDGPPVETALDPPGELDEFLFQATAGQTVVLRLSAPASTGPIQAVFINPHGHALFILRTDGGDRFSQPVLLEITGRHVVRVQGTDGGGYGPYTVEVSTVASP